MWKFIFLAIFAVFCLWTMVESKLSQRREERKEDAFWERENKANSVRRKPIDALDYIHIPDNLPTELLKDNIEIPEILATISRLRDKKILNLTGYTNTDLKLKYGAPNITELSAYDQNYTALVTTLQKWADLLTDSGYEKEAIDIMEFMVSTSVDIGKTYRLLAKFYLKNSQEEKYNNLLETARNLKSLNGPYILRSIEELKNE